MKKFIALFLFAIASMSFKAEAVNWKKLSYGSGIGFFGTISTAYVPWASASLIYFPEVLMNAIKKPNETRWILNTTNRSHLINFVTFYLMTIGSVYLTKKCYDKYQEEAAKEKN